MQLDLGTSCRQDLQSRDSLEYLEDEREQINIIRIFDSYLGLELDVINNIRLYFVKLG